MHTVSSYSLHPCLAKQHVTVACRLYINFIHWSCSAILTVYILFITVAVCACTACLYTMLCCLAGSAGVQPPDNSYIDNIVS